MRSGDKLTLKKQYQRLNKVYELDKKEGAETIKKEGEMMRRNQQLNNIINQI